MRNIKREMQKAFQKLEYRKYKAEQKALHEEKGWMYDLPMGSLVTDKIGIGVVYSSDTAHYLGINNTDGKPYFSQICGRNLKYIGEVLGNFIEQRDALIKLVLDAEHIDNLDKLMMKSQIAGFYTDCRELECE